MTKEEFIKEYCQKSGITWKELSKFEIVLPCACGEPSCKGWAMVSNNEMAIKSHMELYGPKEIKGMSKERQLLRRAATYLQNDCSDGAEKLRAEIEALLEEPEVEPVGYLDTKGNFVRDPKRMFYLLDDRYHGEDGLVDTAYTLEEACNSWKKSNHSHVHLYAIGHTKIANSRLLSWKLLQPEGSFKCRICGKESPHAHSQSEIDDAAECARYLNERFTSEWEELEKLAKDISYKNKLTPLYAIDDAIIAYEEKQK